MAFNDILRQLLAGQVGFGAEPVNPYLEALSQTRPPDLSQENIRALYATRDTNPWMHEHWMNLGRTVLSPWAFENLGNIAGYLGGRMAEASPYMQRVAGGANELINMGYGRLPGAINAMGRLAGAARQLQPTVTPGTPDLYARSEQMGMGTPNIFSGGLGGQLHNLLTGQGYAPSIAGLAGRQISVPNVPTGQNIGMTPDVQGLANLIQPGQGVQWQENSLLRPVAEQLMQQPQLAQSQAGAQQNPATRQLSGQLMGAAGNLLAQPHGLTPEVQQQIMRGVRDTAQQSTKQGVEAAMANLGARGVGTRGALGTQAIMGAHQRAGQQVADAQRQLATQAALARPGELASAIGAVQGPLAGERQYGLQRTQQAIQEAQNLRGMALGAEEQRRQWQNLQHQTGQALGQYGLGYAGLGAGAEQRGLQQRGQDIGLAGQNWANQLNALQTAERLRQSQGGLGLQAALGQAGLGQDYNRLLSGLAGQEAGLGLATGQEAWRQQLGGLGLQSNLASNYANMLQGTIPGAIQQLNWGLGDPTRALYTSLDLASGWAQYLDAQREANYQMHANRRANQPSGLDYALGSIGSLASLGASLPGIYGGLTSMLGSLF